MNKFKEISKLIEKGEDLFVATVIKHKGSTPRTAGAKMIIRPDSSIIGTIGGGIVEADVIKKASEFSGQNNAVILDYNLDRNKAKEGMDIICGGAMTILLEFVKSCKENIELYKSCLSCCVKGEKNYFITAFENSNNATISISRCIAEKEGFIYGHIDLSKPSLINLIEKIGPQKQAALFTVGKKQFLIEPVAVPATVYIFGAGHISKYLAVITKMLGFTTVVLDDREEFANRKRFPDADKVIALDSYVNAFTKLQINRNSYIIIVTRGHLHDKTVLSPAMKTEACYIGMIGSHQKRDTIYKELTKEGIPPEKLENVHSPIGLQIRAETPEEIAVSIAAELIDVRAGAENG